MDVRWLFFDVGGTLVDERDAQLDHAEQLLRALREEGLGSLATARREILRLYRRAGTERSDGLLVSTLDWLQVPQATQQRIRKRLIFRRELERPYPDAVETLAQLKTRGYLIGVIANQPPGLRDRLVSHGLESYVSVCVSSGDTGKQKPAESVFLEALSSAGCEAKDAAMIGDRLDHDIAPAKQIGMWTVRVLTGLYRHQEPRDLAEVPDRTASSLSTLLRLFDHPGAAR